MRHIKVDPRQLEVCAERMLEERSEYERCINELYSLVDAMQASWRGKDNAAFTEEIQKYEGDLRGMSVLCSQYADFLKNSANAYRSTQEEIAACAAGLVR